MKIVQVQEALAQRGYRPGPLDGIWGRQSAAALRCFQTDNGLLVDGIVGPATLKALLPKGQTQGGLGRPSLVWFKEAQRLIGTRENPTRGSNPIILDWADGLGLEYGDDDIPWCGLFVGHCIASTLELEPTPTNLLSARAWSRFGIPTLPTPGAVMVFWRKSISSGLGHVGFYAGEDDKAYRILGGNQSDSVSLAWVGKDRFLGARWPATVPPQPGERVDATRGETLSWDEA